MTVIFMIDLLVASDPERRLDAPKTELRDPV